MRLKGTVSIWGCQFVIVVNMSMTVKSNYNAANSAKLKKMRHLVHAVSSRIIKCVHFLPRYDPSYVPTIFPQKECSKLRINDKNWSSMESDPLYQNETEETLQVSMLWSFFSVIDVEGKESRLLVPIMSQKPRLYFCSQGQESHLLANIVLA
jgi:hypothetical protein